MSLPSFVNEGSVLISEAKSNPNSVCLYKGNSGSYFVLGEDVETYMFYSGTSRINEAMYDIASVNGISTKQIEVVGRSLNEQYVLTEGFVQKILDKIVAKLKAYLDKLFGQIKETVVSKVEGFSKAEIDAYKGDVGVSNFRVYDMKKLEGVSVVEFEYEKMKDTFNSNTKDDPDNKHHSGNDSRNHIFANFFKKFYHIDLSNGSNLNDSVHSMITTKVEENHTITKEELTAMFTFVKSWPSVSNELYKQVKEFETKNQDNPIPADSDPEAHKKQNMFEQYCTCMADILRAKASTYARVATYYTGRIATCVGHRVGNEIKDAVTKDNKSSSEQPATNSESVWMW